MSFDLINPWMLFGLLGLSLPILAHLLSKRKFDVIEWGAMQFLELGQKARRRVRLEQFLLLLLRLGLIALIVFALARPWASGGFLTNLVSTQSRDVVFVIDGSYSMGWEGKAVTPHAAAIQWVHEFLEELRPGDTVALLDARDQVRAVVETPTFSFSHLREQLGKLPPPSGSSNLPEATSRAIRILNRSSNLAREVIVLTDGQSRGWHAEDENLWLRFDDLLTQPRVKPRVWVVDVSEDQPSGQPNFNVDQLKVSRELTVPKFPIRLKTKVRYTGGKIAVSRRVFLEADGQRISEKTVQVRLEPDGEATVEFEYRFNTVGSHLVSVVLDDDNLPGDNRSDASITVADAVPVLLVDGAPHLDATRSETFFAVAALSAVENETPWIRATVIPADQLNGKVMETAETVILANVRTLTDSQAGALKDYVAAGGGLLIAAGDKVNAADYNRLLFDSGNGPLPGFLDSIEEDKTEEIQGVHVQNSSLELPWITRFRSENDGGFTGAWFGHWWKIKTDRKGDSSPDGNADGNKQPRPTDSHTADGEKTGGREVGSVIIAARLTTGDPLLVTRRYGKGNVVLFASPIDADWSTLPAKPDFVALLHELVFYLASGKTARNVDVGTSLVLPLPLDFEIAGFAFHGPGGTHFDPIPAGDEFHPTARLDDTRLPGIYNFSRSTEEGTPAKDATAEYFVVNSDRSESDLTELTETEEALLTGKERMSFVKNIDEMREGMFADESRAEFWHLLLLLFLGMLVFEIVMTRRLVKGGHAVVDEPSPSTAEPAATPAHQV